MAVTSAFPHEAQDWLGIHPAPTRETVLLLALGLAAPLIARITLVEAAGMRIHLSAAERNQQSALQELAGIDEVKT
jgi:hypothetical protein